MKKTPTLILLLAILNIPLKGFTQDVSFFNADGIFSIGTQSNRTASITLSDVDQDGELKVPENKKDVQCINQK